MDKVENTAIVETGVTGNGPRSGLSDLASQDVTSLVLGGCRLSEMPNADFIRVIKLIFRMTREDIASEMGVHINTVAAWSRGQRIPLSVKKYYDLILRIEQGEFKGRGHT